MDALAKQIETIKEREDKKDTGENNVAICLCSKSKKIITIENGVAFAGCRH